jgi:hypothetical protein
MMSARHPVPIDMMEVRQFMRQGAAVSAIVHLLVLALVVLFSEVRPFGAVTTEPIAVDLVTPEEVAKKPEPQPEPTPKPKPEPTPEPKPTPSLDLAQWTKQEATKQETKPAALPQAAAQAQDPPQRQTARPSGQEAKPQPSPPTAAPPPSPALGYTPAEPDVTVKYHVMLGLPEGLPPAVPSSGNKASDDFDATDSTPPISPPA